MQKKSFVVLVPGDWSSYKSEINPNLIQVSCVHIILQNMMYSNMTCLSDLL